MRLFRPSEEMLVERSMTGSGRAQQALYKLYYGYAMSLAMRFFDDEGVAMEVVNDSFLKVFSDNKKGGEIVHFRSWFRKLVINTAIDRYRKEVRIMDDVSLEQIGDVAIDGEQIASANVEDIYKMLHALPPFQRIIFVLYEIEGYSHDEIGQKLGMGVNTSRSHLFRAKKQLKKELNSLWNA